MPLGLKEKDNIRIKNLKKKLSSIIISGIRASTKVLGDVLDNWTNGRSAQPAFVGGLLCTQLWREKQPLPGPRAQGKGIGGSGRFTPSPTSTSRNRGSPGSHTHHLRLQRLLSGLRPPFTGGGHPHENATHASGQLATNLGVPTIPPCLLIC